MRNNIRMKAIIYHRYGSPDVLQLVELPKPVPAEDELLLKIQAVSINGSDRENLVGKPLYSRIGGLLWPRNKILGSDVAGRVEAVGKRHTLFKPGDEIFGELPGYHGGFAEYACTRGKMMALKPAGLTLEQAATIPQAGVIALQGIQQHGKVQAGQRVLINGAGGSTGLFAVQLAKSLGAEVTGVDSAGKFAFMRELGADHVIDYTKEDFTQSGRQYDLILDLIAHRSAQAYTQALVPGGTYLMVGGSIATLLQVLLLGSRIKKATQKNIRLLAVSPNKTDLMAITQLCEAGKIIPMIDRQYPLEQAPEAMRYVGEGRAKGKVVITLSPATI